MSVRSRVLMWAVGLFVALALALTVAEWVLVLRDQQIRWLSILSETVDSFLYAGLMIYLAIFLWKKL